MTWKLYLDDARPIDIELVSMVSSLLFVWLYHKSVVGY
jgi:hypothetical protein